MYFRLSNRGTVHLVYHRPLSVSLYLSPSFSKIIPKGQCLRPLTHVRPLCWVLAVLQALKVQEIERTVHYRHG